MLEFIGLQDEKKWDKLVRQFRQYDVYYLPTYTKAFKLHGDGEPLLIYYQGSGVRAINVVMKRDIADHPHFDKLIDKGTLFDLSTPYGYGGFLVEGDWNPQAYGELNQEYSAFCKTSGIVSEFVRFHPILSNQKSMEYLYDIIEWGKTVSIDLNTPDEILSNMVIERRNRIKKAINSGIEIYWGRDKNLFESFVELYRDTMDRDGARDYYYFSTEFYQSILNDLKHHSMIFYARYQGRIISASIVLFGNGQLHYHLAASLKEFSNLAPNCLLLYEAAQWGFENGYKTFHLGGGLGGKEDNLYRFKYGFNKNASNIFAIGRKIFDEGKYEWLLQQLRTLRDYEPKSDYFPLYRG